ncbi:MAG: hypothetical protein HND52_03700 [Ignavibacteriae bacterium]|nr:hypothetical protein [Ignavibacteriota bacterium]NOG97060.1 hypothetical protein [Ignavibacteriota bacterium]
MSKKIVKSVTAIVDYPKVKELQTKLNKMQEGITELKEKLENHESSLIRENRKLDVVLVSFELDEASRGDVENQEETTTVIEKQIKQIKRELKAKLGAAEILERNLSTARENAQLVRLEALKAEVDTGKKIFAEKYPDLIKDLKAIAETEMTYIGENANQPFQLGLTYDHEYPRFIEMLPLFYGKFDLEKYQELNLRYSPYRPEV